MINASSTLSPYSSFPSAISRAQAPREGSESGMAGEKENINSPRLARQEPTKADQNQIDELKKIDRNVRAHEQAHLAAAGGLAISGASFSYRTGPDGRQYAVGGEVSIDVSPGANPQETISKAERIQAAALAPADPSAQDRSVASAAAQMKLQAQLELSREKLYAPKDGSSASSVSLSNQQKTGSSAAQSQQGIASYRANSEISGPVSGGIIHSTA